MPGLSLFFQSQQLAKRFSAAKPDLPKSLEQTGTLSEKMRHEADDKADNKKGRFLSGTGLFLCGQIRPQHWPGLLGFPVQEYPSRRADAR